jgi:hypothetical protein
MDTQHTPTHALEVSVSESYGKRRYRPENPLAHQFCALLKQQSLTDVDLEAIKALGYEIYTKAVKL